jgi:sialic acid synthase SpsE
MCSAFSVGGFDLVSSFVDRHKLASPEVRAEDICDYLFEQPKPVILSLGCIKKIELSQIMHRIRPKDVVLECASKYPAKMADYDLHNVKALSLKCGNSWGVSDHTLRSDLATFARAGGALYFEKHVDFYPREGAETPDSCVSIPGDRFKTYVAAIRNQEVVDHDAEKCKAIKAYGRHETKEGWVRPYPEASSGDE